MEVAAGGDRHGVWLAAQPLARDCPRRSESGATQDRFSTSRKGPAAKAQTFATPQRNVTWLGHLSYSQRCNYPEATVQTAVCAPLPNARKLARLRYIVGYIRFHRDVTFI